MNRISPVLDRLIGIEDPDELMTEITEVVSDSHIYPNQVVDTMQILLLQSQMCTRGVFEELIFIMVKHDHIHSQM